METTLTYLFEHNLWANRLTLDACSRLNDEQLDSTKQGVYGSIRSTLVHIFGAEERYIARLIGGAPPPLREREPFPGFEELRNLCEKSGQKLIEIAGRAEPTQVLSGTWRDGKHYEMPVTVVLTQAINHGTEHRCQINTVLTSLGLDPLDHDAWAYADAQGQIKIG